MVIVPHATQTMYMYPSNPSSTPATGHGQCQVGSGDCQRLCVSTPAQAFECNTFQCNSVHLQFAILDSIDLIISFINIFTIPIILSVHYPYQHHNDNNESMEHHKNLTNETSHPSNETSYIQSIFLINKTSYNMIHPSYQ